MSYNPYDPGALERLSGMYKDQGNLAAKQIAQKYKLDKASLAQEMKIAMLSSGDKRAAIEQAREDSRGRLELARQEMERLNIPKLQLDQFVAQGNQAIAQGELSVKQFAAQGNAAYQQGQLQQQRDEMLQMGIPKVMVDRFVAETNAAYQRGELGLKRDDMLQIGIPDMLTRRFSAEAQSAYQQGELGLGQQAQQQTGIEQQRRYALDVAKYQQEEMSQPDRYFQAQKFGSQVAPRLLGLEGSAGPQGGPTPGINRMGDLLGMALSGMGPQQATPFQMPTFPTMPGYNPGPVSQLPNFPNMPAYQPPPLGAMPNFPTGGFAPTQLPTAPWAYPTTATGGMPAPGQATSQAIQAQGQPSGMMYAGGGGGFDESGNTAYAGDGGAWNDSGVQYNPYGGGKPSSTGNQPSGGYDPFGYPSGDQPSGGMMQEGGGYDPFGYPSGGGASGGGQPFSTGNQPSGVGPSGGGYDPYGGDVDAYRQAMPSGGALESRAHVLARGQPSGMTPDAGGMVQASGQPDPYGGGVDAYGQAMTPSMTSDAGGALASRSDVQGQAQPSSMAPAAVGMTQASGGQPLSNGSSPGGGYDPYGQGMTAGGPLIYRGDFQTRAQPGYPSGVGPSGGGTTYGGPSSGFTPGYAPSGPAQTGGGSPYGMPDPRIKQLGAVSKASPPSPYDGLSEQDQSTLRLMESIYKQGGQAIHGGEMERLGPAQQGFMKSAGSLLGYDYNDLQQQYKAYRPAQGDARLA